MKIALTRSYLFQLKPSTIGFIRITLKFFQIPFLLFKSLIKLLLLNTLKIKYIIKNLKKLFFFLLLTKHQKFLLFLWTNKILKKIS